MESFITFLVTPLLSNPTKLSIVQKDHIITVDVDPVDVGRMIGKAGATIRSLRTMVKTFCSINNLPQVTLVLNSPPKTPTA